jgi:hypothetical protein
MKVARWKAGLAVTVILSLSLAAYSQAEKPDKIANPYEGADRAATSILNQSLGSVGRRVVVTVSSPGEKRAEYYARIPQDKYSPEGETVALGCAEVTKRINAAVDKAKKGNGSSTITIVVEAKVPGK